MPARGSDHEINSVPLPVGKDLSGDLCMGGPALRSVALLTLLLQDSGHHPNYVLLGSRCLTQRTEELHINTKIGRDFIQKYRESAGQEIRALSESFPRKEAHPFSF